MYFDMILRIDNLAVNSIKQMLDVENANRDKKYDSSLNVSHKSMKNNRYVNNSDTKQERRQQYQNINQAAKNLNKLQ